jgi:hypothetical protein
MPWADPSDGKGDPQTTLTLPGEKEFARPSMGTSNAVAGIDELLSGYAETLPNLSY